jgi:hypothetical protein
MHSPQSHTAHRSRKHRRRKVTWWTRFRAAVYEASYKEPAKMAVKGGVKVVLISAALWLGLASHDPKEPQQVDKSCSVTPHASDMSCSAKRWS